MVHTDQACKACMACMAHTDQACMVCMVCMACMAHTDQACMAHTDQACKACMVHTDQTCKACMACMVCMACKACMVHTDQTCKACMVPTDQGDGEQSLSTQLVPDLHTLVCQQPHYATARHLQLEHRAGHILKCTYALSRGELPVADHTPTAA